MPRKIIIIFGALLFVIIISISLLLLKKKQSSSSSQPTASGFKMAVLDAKSTVERDIKTTFTSSKHKDIITYINLARSEKDKTLQYSYYVKAYAKMLVFYNEAKDADMKNVLLELQNYVKTHLQYKASDFPSPK